MSEIGTGIETMPGNIKSFIKWQIGRPWLLILVYFMGTVHGYPSDLSWFRKYLGTFKSKSGELLIIEEVDRAVFKFSLESNGNRIFTNFLIKGPKLEYMEFNEFMDLDKLNLTFKSWKGFHWTRSLTLLSTNQLKLSYFYPESRLINYSPSVTKEEVYIRVVK